MQTDIHRDPGGFYSYSVCIRKLIWGRRSALIMPKGIQQASQSEDIQVRPCRLLGRRVENIQYNWSFGWSAYITTCLIVYTLSNGTLHGKYVPVMSSLLSATYCFRPWNHTVASDLGTTSLTTKHPTSFNSAFISSLAFNISSNARTGIIDVPSTAICAVNASKLLQVLNQLSWMAFTPNLAAVSCLY
jgi:hypothetical protein